MVVIAVGGSSKKTHYDALSVMEDASYDEIRTGYKAAVLSYHPDKLQTKPKSFNAQNDFLDVQKAWEVLSDLSSRSKYDKELRAFRREDHTGADEIRLEEMSVEDADDSKEFFYQCRCGDYFSITAADLEEMGIYLGENEEIAGIRCIDDVTSASVLLPCGSCSLNIRLILYVNC